MLRATLLALLALLLAHVAGKLVRRAPWFEAGSEPPARIPYSAAAGVRVHCAPRGDPPLRFDWMQVNDTPLPDAPTMRRIHSNGTLEVLPSTVATTHPHSRMTLRCRAANAHGVALSRDVTLQIVSDVSWEAEVTAAAAAVGGVAALRCRATGGEPASAARWFRGDAALDLATPRPEARYVAAGEWLLIRDVSAADAGAYSCLARHDLSALTKRSRPAHLALTAGSVSSAPRLVGAAGDVKVDAGRDFCMACVASEHPPPHYTWYREAGGRLQPVEGTDGAWLWAGGAALCFNGAAATRLAAGAWLCKAYNAFGDATAQVRLHVRDALTVAVSPAVVRADVGGTVRFNCSASDGRAALAWLHDGAPAGAGAELWVRGVARGHRGVYQCFARRAADSAQAAAELQLGDSAPELHYTFIEQALRPGGAAALRCAASGAPLPHLAWLLDGQPLDNYRTQHRYFVSEETSVTGDVVSVLNISAVTVADGGRYTCRAVNALGAADHSARLNVYGPPSIRVLGAVRVVAGANATVHCPYAGYPISSISWWRRGATVAVGGAGRVAARGAELRLAPALSPDAGLYACAVAAPHGPAARRDVEIQVWNPPKISPFMFSSELTEGSSAQVLCGVSSGDKPVFFSWLKDGAPLPSNLQIEEKSLNEFSLLMFSDLTARHSGEYACRVSNHAATVNYTARLSVKVAPAWVTEPLDAAVLLGAPLLLECAAKGHPAPTVSWYRRIGDGGGLGSEGEQWEAVGGAWLSAGGDGATRARNGSLGARAAARRHQGLYRCTADNGVGPPLLKHVNVTVHEPAHFIASGANMSSVRGRGAALSCHALGDAPLALHWTHRGARLDLDSYRWTVSEVRAGGGLRSTLQLRAAERADAGEYRCHAHNQYGRSELTMYLHVEEPPEAPRGLRLAGVGTRWVRMEWWAPAGGVGGGGSSGNDGVLWFTALCTALHALPGADPRHTTLNLTVDSTGDDRLDEAGLRSFSARLEILRPASAYSLRIAAGNHVGQSPYSEPLMFTTLEEAPTASPQNVRVKPAGSGELHVTWSAPPQDGWNGELLGYVCTWRELGRDDAAEARLTAPGWSSAELTASGLRAFARYAVAVRAYNRAGAGPASPLVYATTSDGVPEAPPSSVTCESVTAQSLRLRWSPPPAYAHALRGYDIHYAPFHFSPSWSGAAETVTVRAGAGGEATLQGLAAATNYSVWVRARADAGLGPPSLPVYCATHEDVPGAVEAVRALAAGADAVRVTWLAPARRAGRLTHYTLYTRELGKAGGEWSQRVESAEVSEEEVWREVRGLRPAVYEVWVCAATAAGSGPPSRPVTAAPAHPVTARISSFGRLIHAARGARVRLRCAAVGSPPLRRRWTPLPQAHTVTDTGDLIIHKVEVQSGGNYTCTVRNAGGADAAVFTLAVRLPPSAPSLRLVRADAHALHVAWDAPVNNGAPVLGYTAYWAMEGRGADDAGVGTALVAASDVALTLARLACGAQYRVTLRAHNAVGASPHSQPLLARTRGDKASPAPGKEFVWANSSALRLNLLAWRSRCPVAAWSVALRPAPAPASASAVPVPWRELRTDGERAEAGDLRPGAWYEVRVVARSTAGDATALYRAPTRALSGERIGEPAEVIMEPRGVAVDAAKGGTGAGAGADPWRASLAPALLGGALAALLAGLAGAVAVKRGRAAACLRRECEPRRAADPHPQLYTTEPGKRNGKAMTPPDGSLEISPYATFSMSEGGGGGVGGAGGCALHLRTFGRAEPLDLAAPPPRPNLLHHSAEYGRGRDSDSESSGSPCAACAAELYRLPSAHLSDTLPAVESSAEDTSYSAGGGGRGSRQGATCRVERAERSERDVRAERGERGERGAGQAARGKRRRDHARHASGPSVRYYCAPGPAAAAAVAATAAAARRDAL